MLFKSRSQTGGCCTDQKTPAWTWDTCEGKSRPDTQPEHFSGRGQFYLCLAQNSHILVFLLVISWLASFQFILSAFLDNACNSTCFWFSWRESSFTQWFPMVCCTISFLWWLCEVSISPLFPLNHFEDCLLVNRSKLSTPSFLSLGGIYVAFIFHVRTTVLTAHLSSTEVAQNLEAH